MAGALSIHFRTLLRFLWDGEHRSLSVIIHSDTNMKQELFSMFTKMEHWKDRGGLLTQAAPTPAGRQAVLRHVKELLTHYTSMH